MTGWKAALFYGFIFTLAGAGLGCLLEIRNVLREIARLLGCILDELREKKRF